eukprot:3835411-Rhodomonas_salina.1
MQSYPKSDRTRLLISEGTHHKCHGTGTGGALSRVRLRNSYVCSKRVVLVRQVEKESHGEELSDLNHSGTTTTTTSTTTSTFDTLASRATTPRQQAWYY